MVEVFDEMHLPNVKLFIELSRILIGDIYDKKSRFPFLEQQHAVSKNQAHRTE